MSKAVPAPRAGMSYVTTAPQDRRPIFEISRVAELFIDTLLHYRTLGLYKLHAYVVMPDHVHLLLTPQSITLDQAVALIKNGFAYRLDTELSVWQEGYTGYSVANNHDLEIVRAYLHQLPVRANLAAAPELYPHSSAHRQAPIASMPTPHFATRIIPEAASDEAISQESEALSPKSLRKLAS
jgi:putative transposase